MNTTEFQKKLEAEKTKLESEMASVGRRDPNTKGDWDPAAPEEEEADPNDAATNMQEFGDNAAILADLEARYADVNAALARIDKGTYGKCEVGGEDIEEDRLNADPAATTCKAHL